MKTKSTTSGVHIHHFAIPKGNQVKGISSNRIYTSYITSTNYQWHLQDVPISQNCTTTHQQRKDGVKGHGPKLNCWRPLLFCSNIAQREDTDTREEKDAQGRSRPTKLTFRHTYTAVFRERHSSHCTREKSLKILSVVNNIMNAYIIYRMCLFCAIYLPYLSVKLLWICNFQK